MYTLIVKGFLVLVALMLQPLLPYSDEQASTVARVRLVPAFPPTLLPNSWFLQDTALGILRAKCNTCHRRRNPTRVFTEANMVSFADRIYDQVFVWRRMPKGRRNVLTQEERRTLLAWLTELNIATQ